jgi:chlorobactene glucosyltransferase
LIDTLATLFLLPFVRSMLQLARGWADVPVKPPPAGGPLVSIVVPARNEELTIERCVRSLLGQTYPHLEVIVVDDRSTDRTAEILARLAESDSRLRVMTGRPLPEGWVGKCWALQQGAAEAQGEWLLLVDADTHHQPPMLASAVAFAAERGTDLLTLGPHQELQTVAERALLPAIFGVILVAGGQLAEVNDPKHPLAKANGQFMLFRAQSYWRIGGHESVRDELVEDFAMARRVKGTGHRLLLMGGRDLVSTRMYRSLAEIWEGFSKNAYFEARRQPAGVLTGLVLPWLLIVFPHALLLRSLLRLLRGRLTTWTEWLLFVQSAAQCALLYQFGLQLVRIVRLPVAWALTVPLGLVFFGVVLLNAALRVLSGRGVIWKGRRYEGLKVA